MMLSTARIVARQRRRVLLLPSSPAVAGNARRTFLEQPSPPPAPPPLPTTASSIDKGKGKGRSTDRGNDGEAPGGAVHSGVAAAPATAAQAAAADASSSPPSPANTSTPTSRPASINPAHRKLIERERTRAAANAGYAAASASTPAASPQLLVTNAPSVHLDSGSEAPRPPGDTSAGAAGAPTTATGAGAVDQQPLLEGEWFRSGQSEPNASQRGESSGSGRIDDGNGASRTTSSDVSQGKDGPKSFAEFASRTAPISNSLLVTMPGAASTSAKTAAGGSEEAATPSNSSSSQQPSGTASSSSSSTASSSSSSSTSPDPNTTDVGFLPFLPLQSVPIPSIRHPFNTNRFVAALERTGEFNRPTAEEIMRSTKALLTMVEDKAGQSLVAKTDLENEAYLFSAALSELRTEVQMTARTDGIALRSLGSQVQREVDSLAQKMREDMNALKNDNQLDLNNRKEEASTDINALEQRILDLNSKFTLLIGDTRAALETNKWIQTRRSIVAIVGLAIMVMAYASTRPAPPAPAPPPPPSAADLGLKPLGDEPESSSETGFFSGWLGGSGSATPISGNLKKGDAAAKEQLMKDGSGQSTKA